MTDTPLGEHRSRIVTQYLASALTWTRTAEQLALVPHIVEQLLTLDEERAGLVEEILNNKTYLSPWPHHAEIQVGAVSLLQWQLIIGSVQEAFRER